MATVLFDFDSTLVPVESLEEVLRAGLGDDPVRLRAIEELTRRGMEGEIDFRTSLEARLALAAPTRDAVRRTGVHLASRLTHGVEAVVASLRGGGHQVRIVSGGFRGVILPSARVLGLGEANVHAVGVRWGDDGRFLGLLDDGFPDSKVEGLRRLAPAWPGPVVAVGDGATDHALALAGPADAFVAFTEHVRRAFVDEADIPVAPTMPALATLLHDLIPTLRPPLPHDG